MAVVLNGKEKALIFLSTLGDEVSRKVLSCLPDKISSKITEELNSFPKPSPEAIALVFRELNKIALTRTDLLRLVSPNEAAKAPVKPTTPLGQLESKSPRELLSLLQDEQPQTIAFVLEHLSGGLKTSFFDSLSPGKRNEIKQLNVEKCPLSEVIFQKVNSLLISEQA